MARSFRTLLIVAGAAASMAACAPTVGRHGFQVIDPEADPAKVQVGQDTKSTVLARLGSPSTTSAFEPNTWYYVSQTTQKYTYHKPQVDQRSVTMVSFDPQSETVTEVKTLGLSDGKRIAFNERETPTRGRELTILEQLLGNVGRGGMLPRNDEDNLPGGRRPN
jgi:outer membrane protein assembly factor BamE (lipoprotein component of BamABCDE complex)